jgi:hypothetical protein
MGTHAAILTALIDNETKTIRIKLTLLVKIKLIRSAIISTSISEEF